MSYTKNIYIEMLFNYHVPSGVNTELLFLMVTKLGQ
jgi:hypothetical protein